MKRCLRFLWSLARRVLRLLVISVAATAAGYWMGRHSVPGSFSSPAVSLIPSPAPPPLMIPLTPPKTMSLKHRLALLIQNGGVMGPRLVVELYSLSAGELREVLKIAQTWPGGTGSLLQDQAIAALGFLEPEETLAELLRQPASHMGGVHIADLMTQWAKRDPVAALRQWEEHLARDGFRRNGIENILPELAKKDLPLAFAKLRGLFQRFREHQDQIGAGDALHNLCETMSRPPAAREAVIRELLKPENADAEMWSIGLPLLFRDADYSDPGTLDQTLGWLRAQDIDSAAKAAILTGVLAGRMKREDPATAAEWYLAQAAEAGQPARRSFSEVVSNWPGSDLNACGGWLNRQEPGPELDDAIHRFSLAAADTDVEAAFAWAARITDGSARINSLKLAWSTARRSHSRQETWKALDQAPLSPTDRQTLASRLPPWD